jgi:hypothetical protein
VQSSSWSSAPTSGNRARTGLSTRSSDAAAKRSVPNTHAGRSWKEAVDPCDLLVVVQVVRCPGGCLGQGIEALTEEPIGRGATLAGRLRVVLVLNLLLVGGLVAVGLSAHTLGALAGRRSRHMNREVCARKRPTLPMTNREGVSFHNVYIPYPQRPRRSALGESGQHGGVDPNFRAYSWRTQRHPIRFTRLRRSSLKKRGRSRP